MAINLIFFFLSSLILILCQTIFLPGTALFDQGFDLLIIVVLHISLAYSHYGAVAGIVALGAVMDSLSGGPFFIHIFSYLWVYLIVKMFRQFVFHRSALFVIAVSVAAVGIQQILILFSVFVSQGKPGLLTVDYSLMVEQLFWSTIFIPSGVWVLNLMKQNWKVAIREFKRSMARRYGD